MSEEWFNQRCGAQKILSVRRNSSVNGDKVWLFHPHPDKLKGLDNLDNRKKEQERR